MIRVMYRNPGGDKIHLTKNMIFSYPFKVKHTELRKQKKKKEKRKTT
jgi:hypothetical protein